MKKLLIAIITAISVFVLGASVVSAETTGTYESLTYYISNGEVRITDCDETVTEVVIPETIKGCPVTSIGSQAFENCSSLESVTIPSSITSIGSWAFINCDSLTEITIPDSITSIGYHAFSGCESLKRVDITDIEAWCRIGFSDYCSNPLCNTDNLYLNGELITDLIIPDNVISIGDYAFYSCGSLVSVTIPDSVTSIGKFAFYSCDSLVSVTIPNSVTSIKDYAFECCRNLTSLKIPDSVTSIGVSAFGNCDNLTGINIPSNVTAIGSGAFLECDCLKRVDITDIEAWCRIKFGNQYSNPLCNTDNLYLNGELITDLIIPNSVASIGNYAFYSCGLTSITIPNSVISVGDSAFSRCYDLEGLIIPDSVSSIGKSAFSNCYALTEITIPDSVTSIGESAFWQCRDLISVTIGKGITLIPDSAFCGCKVLKAVCLPAELLYIRNDAFSGCSGIETVFYAGSEEQWNSILKYNRNENLTDAAIIYNAAKKTYKFVTNCENALPDITDYAVFTSPVVINEGKTFQGWYDSKALSGEPIAFPYYGSASVLYASWTDRTGTSFSDAFTAKAGGKYTVTASSSNKLIYYSLVPARTREYHFYSTGSMDTYGYLYNGNQGIIAKNDDSGDGRNFYISHRLNAGETYYIAVKSLGETGTFVLVTEEAEEYRINSVKVKNMQGDELAEIPNGSFLAEISVTNVSADKDTVVVLAQYSAQGFCKNLMYVSTEDIPSGSVFKLTLPVDNTNGDIVKLKAFVWESFKSITPSGSSASFPEE